MNLIKVLILAYPELLIQNFEYLTTYHLKYKNFKNLPSEVKEAKAEDLASCLAGALYYKRQH